MDRYCDPKQGISQALFHVLWDVIAESIARACQSHAQQGLLEDIRVSLATRTLPSGVPPDQAENLVCALEVLVDQHRRKLAPEP